MILKIANLVSLLLAEAWFINSPDWEPAILFITLLGTLIAQEIKSKNDKPINNTSEHDKSLYEQFLKELPFEGSIEFIRDHDFHYSFLLEDIKQLMKFTREWDNAEHEFLNNDLENDKKELFNKIKKFVYDSGMKTFPRGGMQSVMNDLDEEHNLTKSTRENIVLLNNYGDDIFELHQKFVRKGKNTLYI